MNHCDLVELGKAFPTMAATLTTSGIAPGGVGTLLGPGTGISIGSARATIAHPGYLDLFMSKEQSLTDGGKVLETHPLLILSAPQTYA